MSLLLTEGTRPHGLRTKAWGPTILVGEYQISLEDFLALTLYVLMNTDLEAKDPRLSFLEFVRRLKEVDGYNPGGRRLAPKESET
jgi:hypothetical protein